MSVSGTAPVLVVEDDVDVREAIKEVCEGEGYTVITARNGAEAKAHIRRGLDPCVVLLDIMLPDEDGHALGSWLREHPRLEQTPVIVLSGDPRIAERAASIRAGHLTKPFPIEQLIAVVERHCGRRGTSCGAGGQTPP